MAVQQRAPSFPKMLWGVSLAMGWLVLYGQCPALAQAAKVPGEADKLHVVLLVDGTDKVIGGGDKHDVAAMKSIISGTIGKDPKRVVYHDLTGKNRVTGKYWTGPEVLKNLQALKIGPNDNVLVYHSGHGNMADHKHPEASHNLAIDGGWIERKAIVAAVQAKKPRGLIVLTDCCSNFTDSKESFVSLDPAKPNAATVRNLLLKTTGFVSITAAEDGHTAESGWVGDNPAHAGSCFTVAITRLWFRQNETFGTWKDFFPKLRQETYVVSSHRHRARAFHLGDPLIIPPAAAAMPKRDV
jgi:hypothetical protein